jgi:hypothetical protein
MKEAKYSGMKNSRWFRIGSLRAILIGKLKR